MFSPFPPLPWWLTHPQLGGGGECSLSSASKPGFPQAALPKQAAGAGKGVQGAKCCATDSLPFSLSFPGATFEKPGQQEKDGTGGEILECRLIKPDRRLLDINKGRGVFSGDACTLASH